MSLVAFTVVAVSLFWLALIPINYLLSRILVRKAPDWFRKASKESREINKHELISQVLGGRQTQKEYKDFVDRYERGNLYSEEVLKRYDEVSHAVSPDQYAQAAQEALSKLSPEERAEFLKMLQERAAARGVKLPGKVASDPKDLGQVLTDLHEKPGQLRDILGPGGAQPGEQAQGSITDMLTSPLAKAVLAGIAAMVIKRVTQARGQGDHANAAGSARRVDPAANLNG
jgi:hypothetical protein